ncbi:DUF3440 domain-containing protein, partial [Escherichia coli]|nr:DUF3440 domain-containing protein [Escherichia coli]
KACVLPENPASYRVVRTKSYLFNKALSSMPVKTAEHYRNKIAIYLHWYQKKGIEVPQTQQGDIGAKDVPSWRRICKVLLNNDYWCRALSFSPTKSKNYQRYNERIKGKRQEWGILCNND